MSQKLRNCLITCFDLEQGRKLTPNENFKYIVYQIEQCPKTSKLHLQGYIELTKEIRFNTLKKLLPAGTHIEPRKGTQAEAIAYCTKEETRVEPPVELGEKKEQGKRNDIVSFRDAIKEGATNRELIENMPALVAKYSKFISDVRSAYSEPRNWITEVIVLFGPSGCGKTKYVYDNETDFDTITYCNNFFLGYTGKHVILIDSFEPNDIPRGLFLRLLDRYAMTVKIKNGEMNWNPKKIYITTNFDPNNWYVQSEAVMTRITKFINFYDAD